MLRLGSLFSSFQILSRSHKIFEKRFSSCSATTKQKWNPLWPTVYKLDPFNKSFWWCSSFVMLPYLAINCWRVLLPRILLIWVGYNFTSPEFPRKFEICSESFSEVTCSNMQIEGKKTITTLWTKKPTPLYPVLWGPLWIDFQKIYVKYNLLEKTKRLRPTMAFQLQSFRNGGQLKSKCQNKYSDELKPLQTVRHCLCSNQSPVKLLLYVYYVYV